LTSSSAGSLPAVTASRGATSSASPPEVRGKYKQIDSNVPGLQVGELLPHMARCMDKVALVRSGAHNNDHHETATNWVLCGRFGSAFGDYPLKHDPHKKAKASYTVGRLTPFGPGGF